MRCHLLLLGFLKFSTQSNAVPISKTLSCSTVFARSHATKSSSMPQSQVILFSSLSISTTNNILSIYVSISFNISSYLYSCFIDWIFGSANSKSRPRRHFNPKALSLQRPKCHWPPQCSHFRQEAQPQAPHSNRFHHRLRQFVCGN